MLRSAPSAFLFSPAPRRAFSQRCRTARFAAAYSSAESAPSRLNAPKACSCRTTAGAPAAEPGPSDPDPPSASRKFSGGLAGSPPGGAVLGGGTPLPPPENTARRPDISRGNHVCYAE